MFVPEEKILQNYASVMVDFALGGGAGIGKKDVVYLQFDLPAMPLALKIYLRILEKGAHPLLKINEESFSKIFYEFAQSHQLDFFPKDYSKALVNTIDHKIYLMADRDPLHLKDVDPTKIFRAQQASKLLKKWLFNKEDRGKLTWSLCLYGTEGMAKEAGISEEEYWNQIATACFLDKTDPIKKWRSTFTEVKGIIKQLNEMPIDKIHLTAKNTDLWIKYGEKRKFVGVDGRNIPSFEIFTSPDWRETNGHIYFDFPLYRFGNIIQKIYLEFKDGKLVKARAEKNEKLLLEMIKQKGADHIGEFSLTDVRFSKITKFMANTLFDENFGGKYGNTHLALGSSYHDCFSGNPKFMSGKSWQELGYNDSAEHTDIIATTDRSVDVFLKNGQKKLIYKNGRFVLDKLAN